MDDLIFQIAANFGLKVYSMNKLKSSFLLNTNSGIKLIKKTNIPIENIEAIHYIKEYLFNNGFKNIDRYNESVQNKPYYFTEGQAYTVTDFFDLNFCSFESIDDAVLLSKTLATFHSITGKLQFPGSKILFSGKNLNVLYRRRMVELSHIKKWVEKQSRLSEFDVLFIKNYTVLRESTEKALFTLTLSNYSALYKEAIRKSELCHNALKEENVKKSEKNEIYLTNFEDCSFDYHINDLAMLLRRHMKSKYFSTKASFEIIKTYDKINTITKEDFDVLKAILLFPEKYLRICNEYYNKRRTYIASGMIKRLESSIIQKERQEKFMLEL